MFSDQFYEKLLSVSERNIKLLMQKLMQKSFYDFHFYFLVGLKRNTQEQPLQVFEKKMSFCSIYL